MVMKRATPAPQEFQPHKMQLTTNLYTEVQVIILNTNNLYLVQWFKVFLTNTNLYPIMGSINNSYLII